MTSTTRQKRQQSTCPTNLNKRGLFNKYLAFTIEAGCKLGAAEDQSSRLLQFHHPAL